MQTKVNAIINNNKQQHTHAHKGRHTHTQTSSTIFASFCLRFVARFFPYCCCCCPLATHLGIINKPQTELNTSPSSSPSGVAVASNFVTRSFGRIYMIIRRRKKKQKKKIYLNFKCSRIKNPVLFHAAGRPLSPPPLRHMLNAHAPRSAAPRVEKGLVA